MLSYFENNELKGALPALVLWEPHIDKILELCFVNFNRLLTGTLRPVIPLESPCLLNEVEKFSQGKIVPTYQRVMLNFRLFHDFGGTCSFHNYFRSNFFN
jgi:hypothetical protein